MNDFVYGRLRNQAAIEALPYIATALDRVVSAYDADVTQAIVFQRDEHEATEAEYLLSSEGKKFPYFHCPKGDPGMEVVPELKPYEKNFAFRTSPAGKAYIFDPVTVRTLQDIYADYGSIDEIHFYGFLTGMCVAGAAIQARANFQSAEIYVHARGTADVNEALHRAALALLERNFINIVR